MTVRQLTDQLLGESLEELEPLGPREGLIHILAHAQAQVHRLLPRRPSLTDLRYFLARCDHWMEDIDADKFAPPHAALWQQVITRHQEWTRLWSPSPYKSTFAPRRTYSLSFSVIVIGLFSCLLMFTSVVPSFGQGPFGTSTNMVPSFPLPSGPYMSPGYETPLMENSKFAANETIEHHVDFIRPQGARVEDDPMPGMVVFVKRNVRQAKDVQPYCHLVTLQHLNRLLYEDSRKDDPRRRRYKSVADIHRDYSYLGIVEKVNPVDGTQRGLVGVMMKVVVVVQGRVRAINIFEPKEMYGTTEVPRQHGTDLAFLYKMVPVNENEWFKQLKGHRLATEKRDLQSKRKSKQTLVRHKATGNKSKKGATVDGDMPVDDEEQSDPQSGTSGVLSIGTFSKLNAQEKAKARARVYDKLQMIAYPPRDDESKVAELEPLTADEITWMKRAVEYIARDYNLYMHKEEEGDPDPAEDSSYYQTGVVRFDDVFSRPSSETETGDNLNVEPLFTRGDATFLREAIKYLGQQLQWYRPVYIEAEVKEPNWIGHGVLHKVVEDMKTARKTFVDAYRSQTSSGNSSSSSQAQARPSRLQSPPPPLPPWSPQSPPPAEPFRRPMPPRRHRQPPTRRRTFQRQESEDDNDMPAAPSKSEDEEEEDNYELPPSLAENIKPDMTWQIVPMATKSGLPIDEKLYTSLEEHDFYIGDLRHVGKSSWNHMNVRHHMYADRIHQFVFQREPGQCFELVGKFMQIDIHLRR